MHMGMQVFCRVAETIMRVREEVYQAVVGNKLICERTWLRVESRCVGMFGHCLVAVCRSATVVAQARVTQSCVIHRLCLGAVLEADRSTSRIDGACMRVPRQMPRCPSHRVDQGRGLGRSARSS